MVPLGPFLYWNTTSTSYLANRKQQLWCCWLIVKWWSSCWFNCFFQLPSQFFFTSAYSWKIPGFGWFGAFTPYSQLSFMWILCSLSIWTSFYSLSWGHTVQLISHVTCYSFPSQQRICPQPCVQYLVSLHWAYTIMFSSWTLVLGSLQWLHEVYFCTSVESLPTFSLAIVFG